MESDLYLQCRSLARKDGVNHHKKILCALVPRFDSLEIEKKLDICIMDNQCGEKEKKAKDIQEEGGERMCERKNKSEEKRDGKC
jgi:hypothetical protein